MKRNSSGSPKYCPPTTNTEVSTRACLNDVFSGLQVEKKSKRVRFSDSVDDDDTPLSSTGGWAVSKYGNLVTPSRNSNTQLRNLNKTPTRNSNIFNTPSSSNSRNYCTPLLNRSRNVATPLTSRGTFETPSSSSNRIRQQTISHQQQQHHQQHHQQQSMQLSQKSLFDINYATNFSKNSINGKQSLFDFNKHTNNTNSNVSKHQTHHQFSTIQKRMPIRSNLFASTKSDSENLLKKTLKSTKAAKDLDLLLK